VDRDEPREEEGATDVERLYRDYLDRVAQGESLGLATFAEEHPEHRDSLLELHRIDEFLNQARGSSADSIPERIKKRFGDDADPGVSLEREDAESPGDLSTAVLERLVGRLGARHRYRIKSFISRGGQGKVYRVWDEDLRRNLAMKVLLAKGDAEEPLPAHEVDTRTLARFLEEAQVTGQLDHPGIVPVHELGLDSRGRVYFTMKLVKGRNLEAIFDLVEEGAEGWSRTRALGVLIRVCEAMSYAHAKGVIHRDLKPSNVMVGKYGEVYVMDWGLARVTGIEDRKDLRVQPAPESTVLRSARREAASPDSPLITMDGDVLGSPAYMSPEQAHGDLKAVGPHSDVYAAGAMLYHLLAGHMPYVPPGKSAGNHAVLQRVREGPPEPLEKVAPGAPGELVAICERAMARDWRERHPDMGALAADLQAYVEGRVVPTYERGALAELRKWVRRNRGLAAAIAAAVLLALSGMAGVAWVESARRRAVSEGLAQVERFADAARIRSLDAAARELWPRRPELVGAYESWLAQAREVRGRVPERVAAFRAWASDPAGAPTHLDPEFLGALADQLEDGLRLLDERIADVERRREFARTIESRTVAGWAPPRADIRASEAYGGLDLPPQIGLLPLRPDRRSGLWEFWHVASGARPERDGEGELIVAGDTGMVFVLLPGGTSRMGMEPGTDPRFAEDAPRNDVPLDPFFISKYELTDGQWQRLREVDPILGARPRAFPADDPTHPAGASERELSEVLARVGLLLSTEAQWEYAARAGTRSARFAWWTGSTVESLEGTANVLDLTRVAVYAAPDPAPFEDGFVAKSPVGSFHANAFGLHDVVGNVWEWCRDLYGDYAFPVQAGDGLRLVPAGQGDGKRVIRGSSFADPAEWGMSGCRSPYAAVEGSGQLGARPVMPIRW